MGIIISWRNTCVHICHRATTNTDGVSWKYVDKNTVECLRHLIYYTYYKYRVLHISTLHIIIFYLLRDAQLLGFIFKLFSQILSHKPVIGPGDWAHFCT
jgi:hypothetical protein